MNHRGLAPHISDTMFLTQYFDSNLLDSLPDANKANNTQLEVLHYQILRRIRPERQYGSVPDPRTSYMRQYYKRRQRDNSSTSLAMHMHRPSAFYQVRGQIM